MENNVKNVIITGKLWNELVVMFHEEEVLILDKKNTDITKNIIGILDGKYQVQFEKKGKIFLYFPHSLTFLTHPSKITDCSIRTSHRTLSNINKVLKFDTYIKVFFQDGSTKTYLENELTIQQSLLKYEEAQKVFHYFKEMANHLTIQDMKQEDYEFNKNSTFLKGVYDEITFLNENSVLKYYLMNKKVVSSTSTFKSLIYPFRFNLSQQEAVKNAFTSGISVIEGPPGTGKTQTILNIIANAIFNHKTVAVLSNNNSATDNVFEKLEKQGLDSICAKLGNHSNVNKFIENQTKLTNSPEDWNMTNQQVQEAKQQLFTMEHNINHYLKQQNEIAFLEQELEELLLEQKYFLDCQTNINLHNVELPNFKALKLHSYLLYLNKQHNKTEYFSPKIQLFSQLKFRFLKPKLYKNNIEHILEAIEYTYYQKRIQEIQDTIKSKKKSIVNLDLETSFQQYTTLSMKLFKSHVYQNYRHKNRYNKNSLKNTSKLVKDYPVILSTTYSLIKCVSSDFLFDYVIVDESSQVDLISSFPALSLAKNIIVVGDSKQLPNIIDNRDNKMQKWNSIFEKHDIDEKYNYTKNSLLSLTKNLNNSIPSVMLREHYRCHPKIIGFCNKKFYNNELIILSKNSHDNPIKQYKCVKGNHARKNNDSQFNERQAQVILQEVIPNEHIDIHHDSVGIITPYRAQKDYLIKQVNCPNVGIDTVYGFQGRERDIIIFSTVANNITSFLDNPNSINVAVSRAVNQLFLVTPYEYKTTANSNISNLIRYISYQNFEVIQSKINSVFDLLYKANETKLAHFLNTHSIFSKFPSETLIYHLICNILTMDEYQTYAVTNKTYPLRKIVKNRSILNEEELQFIKRNSHIDFLIYNKFDKMPILAIEVDGYHFHNQGEQIIRDKKKDQILKKCGIPLLRLRTNECDEEKRIIKKLDEIIKAYVTIS